MHHATIAGKAVLTLSQQLNLGAGSTWPGHISLKIDKKFIKKAIQKNPDLKVILIAGTNGKTTTTKTLAKVLADNEISVMTNESGANLLNGLATLIAKHIDLKGRLKNKALIFEVDENSLPLVLDEIPNPASIILLNLFRDQLDRYGEVNTTAEKWAKTFEKLGPKTLVVANSDDPLVAYSASQAVNHKFFSVLNIYKTGKALSHAVDSITCPKCNSRLDYLNVSYSHLGDYICPKCDFKTPKASPKDIDSPLIGTYNQYNLNAVLTTAMSIFGISKENILKSFKNTEPAFGRQEKFEVEGKKIMLLLSKNPTGFNESLKLVMQNKNNTLLLILNDRIPDGRDISWIWDVDFEELRYSKKQIFVSGDRAYDLSNRLIFAGVTHVAIDNFKQAIKEAIKKTQDHGEITILPTYSAMLEAREEIVGRKIL